MNLFDFVEKCYEKYGNELSFERYVYVFMDTNFMADGCVGHEMFGQSDEEEYLGGNFKFKYKLDVENRQIIFPIIIDTEGVLD